MVSERKKMLNSVDLFIKTAITGFVFADRRRSSLDQLR
jgi:hypothetical protein